MSSTSPPTEPPPSRPEPGDGRRWIPPIAWCGLAALGLVALALAGEWLDALVGWYFARRWDIWMPWAAALAATAWAASRRPSSEPPAPARFGRGDLLAIAPGVVAGVVLFTLPDAIWWARTGHTVWVSDRDDMLYLAVGSQAYFNHPWRLGDPSRPEGGVPLYSWIPCVPGVLLAKAAHLDPVGIGLAWRLLAGITVPIGWYVLLRRRLGVSLISALAVVLLVSDQGSIVGEPIVLQTQTMARLAAGDSGPLRSPFRPPGTPWRVTTPGNIFLFYAAYMASIQAARSRPGIGRILFAGVAFGLLFAVYFYYWTAAALALGLGALFDRGRRAIAVGVGAVGGLIGLPILLVNRSTYGATAEAFERFNLFLKAASPEWMFSATETGLIAALLVWAYYRHRDLLPIGALALAGWLLANQHVASGVQIQGDHWRLHAVGPAVSLIVVLIVLGPLPRLARRRRTWAVALLGCATAFNLASCIALRTMTALHAASASPWIDGQLRYRDQRMRPGVPRLEPNAVVAGDAQFIDWAMILENQRMLASPWLLRHCISIGHREWNSRIALNGYLRGLDRGRFLAEQRAAIAGDFFGPWAKDSRRKDRLLAERLRDYDAIASDPAPYLDRFGVRYLGLPAGESPSYGQATDAWELIDAGPTWWVWARNPRPGFR